MGHGGWSGGSPEPLKTGDNMTPKKSRTTWVKVRVNEAEREQYQRMATAADMPLSDLIRQRMQQPIVAAPRAKQRRLRTDTADPALMRQLAAIGNNLNQLARAANRHGLRSTDTAMVLAYLSGVQDEIRALRESQPAQENGGDDAP